MPRDKPTPQDPFDDRHARFAAPQGQPRYPPGVHTVQYADSGDMGFGTPGGGVTIDGQHVPWAAADEDDELKPLTG